jgi:hypothetical protein
MEYPLFPTKLSTHYSLQNGVSIISDKMGAHYVYSRKNGVSISPDKMEYPLVPKKWSIYSYRQYGVSISPDRMNYPIFATKWCIHYVYSR